MCYVLANTSIFDYIYSLYGVLFSNFVFFIDGSIQDAGYSPRKYAWTIPSECKRLDICTSLIVYWGKIREKQKGERVDHITPIIHNHKKCNLLRSNEKKKWKLLFCTCFKDFHILRWGIITILIWIDNVDLPFPISSVHLFESLI